MEKPQLVNFIAKVLEESGFKVYKNFKTSSQVVDIYAVLPTSMGDFGVVVGCKNYDKQWEVGIDVLKEMEMIGKTLKASKVTIVTSSSFSAQAIKYGTQRNIKLVDRKNLIALAKKFAEKEKNKKNIKNRRIDENIDQADIPIERYDKITELDDFKSGSSSYYDQFKNLNEFNAGSNPYNSLEDYEADKNYYESAVGYSPNENYGSSNQNNYKTSTDYDNYEDNFYHEEFLNSNIYNSGYYSSEIENSSNPSRLGKINQSAKKSRFNFRKNNSKNNFNNKSRNKGNKTKAIKNVVNAKNISKTSHTIFNKLEPLLHHTISQILIVILASYILSFLLGAIAKIPTGFLGIIELVIALLLSYGMAFYSAENKRDGTNILIKGSLVFFISLICLMVLIVLIR